MSEWVHFSQLNVDLEHKACWLFSSRLLSAISLVSLGQPDWKATNLWALLYICITSRMRRHPNDDSTSPWVDPLFALLSSRWLDKHWAIPCVAWDGQVLWSRRSVVHSSHLRLDSRRRLWSMSSPILRTIRGCRFITIIDMAAISFHSASSQILVSSISRLSAKVSPG